MRDFAQIDTGEIDGFVVHRNAASFDAWPMARAFLDGAEVGTVLSDRDPRRIVHRIEKDGKPYIVKRVLEAPGGWKRAFRDRILGGTFFRRLMRSVLEARKKGCGVVQDFHLVAERFEGGICREVVMVLEYVEGEALASIEEMERHREAAREAMIELHRHGLAIGDVNHKNFIVRGNAMRIIDLSSRDFPSAGRAKDVVRMWMWYRIRLPVRGLSDRLWLLFFNCQLRVFYLLRKLRKVQKTNPLAPR